MMVANCEFAVLADGQAVREGPAVEGAHVVHMEKSKTD
jgi:hypothetical protein